jgi:hypothetical protein
MHYSTDPCSLQFNKRIIFAIIIFSITAAKLMRSETSTDKEALSSDMRYLLNASLNSILVLHFMFRVAFA